MPVFFVQLSGSGVRGKFDDEVLECGFIKNEYVLAGSPEKAKKKAVENVRRKLLQRTNVNKDDVQSAAITIDQIESGASWLSLFSEDGFVFHPVE